jgi:hypothetical protein
MKAEMGSIRKAMIRSCISFYRSSNGQKPRKLQLAENRRTILQGQPRRRSGRTR